MRKASESENLPWKYQSPYFDEDKETKGVSAKPYFKGFHSGNTQFGSSLGPSLCRRRANRGEDLLRSPLLQSEYYEQAKGRSKSTNKRDSSRNEYKAIVESESEYDNDSFLPSIAVVLIALQL